MLPILVVGIRKAALRTCGGALKHGNQSRRRLIGQGLEQGSVDKAEDADAGGHSKGEGNNRGDGECGRFAKLAQSESQIGTYGFDCRQLPDLGAALFHQAHIPTIVRGNANREKE